MNKIISSILGKYSQLINTYYDEDNFNIPVFSVLLKLEKEQIKEMWIGKSIKVINKRLSILMGYVTFLQNRYIEKLPFSKEVISNLKKYARKWGKKHLTFSKLNLDEKEKAIEALFTIWPLIEVIDQIMMIKYGFINELEKFFNEKINDKNERMIRQEQICKFDSSYHFSYFLDNNIFRYRAMLYFYYCMKRDDFCNLEESEQYYFKKIFRIISKKYDISKDDIKKDFSEIEHISYSKALNRSLSIDDVIVWFEKFTSAVWLNTTVSSSKNYTNFAVNFNQIKIPTWDAFSKITLYEFLKLCIHEVETHWYCFHNTLLSTWQKITLPQNNIRDEWLAKINELLLLKSFKKKIKPNHNMLRIFIWKELSWKQYLYFLKILEKIDHKAKWLNKRFLRYKKFYASDLPWSFSKDVCYDVWTYWARKHLDKLKDEKSIIPYISLQFLRVWHRNLSFSEAYLRNILKKNSINENSNKDVINFLIKEWYMLKWFNTDYILHNLLNKKYIEVDFHKKMKKNYYFIPSDAIKYLIENIPRKKLDEIVTFLKEKSFVINR